MRIQPISHHSSSSFGSLLHLLIVPNSLIVIGQWDDSVELLRILGIYSRLKFGLKMMAVDGRDKNLFLTLFGLEEKMNYSQIKRSSL